MRCIFCGVAISIRNYTCPLLFPIIPVDDATVTQNVSSRIYIIISAHQYRLTAVSAVIQSAARLERGRTLNNVRGREGGRGGEGRGGEGEGRAGQGRARGRAGQGGEGGEGRGGEGRGGEGRGGEGRGGEGTVHTFHKPEPL